MKTKRIMEFKIPISKGAFCLLDSEFWILTEEIKQPLRISLIREVL